MVLMNKSGIMHRGSANISEEAALNLVIHLVNDLDMTQENKLLQMIYIFFEHNGH